MKKTVVFLLLLSTTCLAQLDTELKLYGSSDIGGNEVFKVNWDSSFDGEKVNDFIRELKSENKKIKEIESVKADLETKDSMFRNYVKKIIEELNAEISQNRPILAKNLEACFKEDELNDLYDKIRLKYRDKVQEKVVQLNQRNSLLLKMSISANLDIDSLTIQQGYKIGNTSIAILSLGEYHQYLELIEHIKNSKTPYVTINKLEELSKKDKSNQTTILKEFLNMTIKVKKTKSKLDITLNDKLGEEFRMVMVKLFLQDRLEKQTSYREKMLRDFRKKASIICSNKDFREDVKIGLKIN